MDHNETPKISVSKKKEEGDEYFKKKNYESAIAQYTKALYLSPDNVELLRSRGQCYLELCDFKAAISNFRKACSLPKSPQDLKDLLSELLDLTGYMYLRRKQYKAAESYFNEAISVNGTVANFWLHRCLALVGLKNFENALKDADHYICLNSKDASVYVLRAKIFWKLRNSEKGNADIEKAFAVDPNHKESLMYKRKIQNQSRQIYEEARTFIVQGEYEMALKTLHRAIKSNSKDIKIRILRAVCYRELRRYDQAMNDVKIAERVYEKSKNSAKTKNETIIAQNYSNPDITHQKNLILNDMAISQMETKNYYRALTLLNEAIESEASQSNGYAANSTDWRFYLNRGDCYRELGKNSSALADYNYALERDVNCVEIRRRIAMIHDLFGLELFNLGQLDRAEIEFSLAIQHNPQMPVYYVHRGDTAHYQQKSAQAFSDYKKAVQLDPSNLVSQEKLRQFQASKKDTYQAGSSSLKSPLEKRVQFPPAKGAKQIIQSPEQRKLRQAAAAFKKKNRNVRDLFNNRIEISAAYSLKQDSRRKHSM